MARAAAAAARADVILAFVGEESILSGEAHCLADLDLQGDQGALITALAKTGKPVVTIVMAGRPLTIGKEVEESTAVLYSFHPGTMAVLHWLICFGGRLCRVERRRSLSRGWWDKFLCTTLIIIPDVRLHGMKCC